MPPPSAIYYVYPHCSRNFLTNLGLSRTPVPTPNVANGTLKAKCFMFRRNSAVVLLFAQTRRGGVSPPAIHDLLQIGAQMSLPPLCKGRCRGTRRRDCGHFLCGNGTLPQSLCDSSLHRGSQGDSGSSHCRRKSQTCKGKHRSSAIRDLLQIGAKLTPFRG